jgi:sporulation protein YlmC with PRC-barrel domain
MDARRLDLLREVLDHELVDADGVSCGMVDDLEFEARDGGPAVTALLVGTGAWAPRLPPLFARAMQGLFGRAKIRVPWNQVGEIGETIRLQAKASELGLGVLDRKVGRWIAKLPKA